MKPKLEYVIIGILVIALVVVLINVHIESTSDSFLVARAPHPAREESIYYHKTISITGIKMPLNESEVCTLAQEACCFFGCEYTNKTDLTWIVQFKEWCDITYTKINELNKTIECYCMFLEE